MFATFCPMTERYVWIALSLFKVCKNGLSTDRLRIILRNNVAEQASTLCKLKTFISLAKF